MLSTAFDALMNVHQPLDPTGDGWDAFKERQLTPEQRADVDRMEALAKQRAAAVARVYATPDGRELFELLADVTVRRGAFLYAHGMSAEAVALQGVMREGQNSMFAYLLQVVSAGLAGAAVPPEPEGSQHERTRSQPGRRRRR